METATQTEQFYTNPGLEASKIIDDLEDIIQSYVKTRVQLKSDKAQPLRKHLERLRELVEQQNHSCDLLLKQKSVNSIDDKLAGIEKQLQEITADLKESNKKQLKTNQQTSRALTFAEAVKKSSNQEKANTCTVLVTDHRREQKAEDLRENLIQTVNPKNLGIQVTKVITTKNKSLLVKVKSLEQAKILSQEIERKKGDLRARPLENKSKIIVFNVPQKHKEEELLTALAETAGTFTTVRNFPGKENTLNWILEAPTYIVNSALRAPRIYLGFRLWYIRRYHQVLLCYRCQGLGHRAAACQKEQRCGMCSGKHSTKTCPKTEEVRCCNCLERNKEQGLETPTNHPPMSRQCPTQKMMLYGMLSRKDKSTKEDQSQDAGERRQNQQEKDPQPEVEEQAEKEQMNLQTELTRTSSTLSIEEDSAERKIYFRQRRKTQHAPYTQ